MGSPRYLGYRDGTQVADKLDRVIVATGYPVALATVSPAMVLVLTSRGGAATVPAAGSAAAVESHA